MKETFKFLSEIMNSKIAPKLKYYSISSEDVEQFFIDYKNILSDWSCNLKLIYWSLLFNNSFHGLLNNNNKQIKWIYEYNEILNLNLKTSWIFFLIPFAIYSTGIKSEISIP